MGGFARTGGSEGLYGGTAGCWKFEKWGMSVAIEYRHWECQLCLKTRTTTLKNGTKW
jgi:hypothetical protein